MTTDNNGKNDQLAGGAVMSLSDPNNVKNYYNTLGANWGDNYIPDDVELPTNPAILRMDLVRKMIEEFKVDNIFDAGCADATVMKDILDMGLNVRGIDFSQVLVDKGRERLTAAGYSPDLCRIGDVTKIDEEDNSFDGVVCLGVLPHIDKINLALEELVRICRPGAKLILSFRNDLFDLFTFNRFTVEFVEQHFLSAIDCTEEERARARESIAKMITNPEKPAANVTEAQHQEFGDLTRINHNPLTIAEDLRPFGLTLEKTGYYKYHPFPPLISGDFPNYKELGAKMDREYPYSWIGAFMCSTFVSVFSKD